MLLNSEGDVRCGSGTLSLALDNLGDWRVVEHAKILLMVSGAD